MAGDEERPPELEGFDSFSLVGRGGMASVWSARQIALDRPVAIKTLDPEHGGSDEDIDRFQSEARAAARLSHPGIVQVFDAFYRGGRFCLVMELVEGATLGVLVRRRGRLLRDEALRLAGDVAAALGYAWEKLRLVHCDVKPENILVDPDGGAKLADFGLARSLASLAVRRADGGGGGCVFGTPAYMPPEQCTGEPVLEPQADMYALGATLYHVVTGRRLFADKDPETAMRRQVEDRAPAPRRFAPELDAPFVAFLERLLAKNPADRFASWADVSASVAALLAGAPVPFGPLPPEAACSVERMAPVARPAEPAGPVAPAAAAPVPRPGRAAAAAFAAAVALLALSLAGLAARRAALARRGERLVAFVSALEAAPPPTPDSLVAAIGALDALLAVPDEPGTPGPGRARVAALRTALGQTRVARATRLAGDLAGGAAAFAAAAPDEASRLRRARLAADRLRRYDGPWADETRALRETAARRLRAARP